MRHARADYEAIQPWPTKRPHFARVPLLGNLLVEGPEDEADPIIPDDEPVFILRAKDRTAPDIVRAWATAQYPDGDLETAARVRLFADEMERYAAEHYAGGKTADTPHHLLVPVQS